MKKIISIIIPLVLFYVCIQAQKAPIKYGKVSMEELQMTAYEKDSSAPAVILCDYGYFNANEFRFSRIMRIKILSKEGYDYANQEFPAFWTSNVRGKTFNLENGEIVAEKLRSENIYVERVYGDYTKTRVSMPNVKVGSVIELQFSISGPPSEWYFQSDIPTKYSEIRFEESNYLDFKRSSQGAYYPRKEGSNRWIAENIPAYITEPYSRSRANNISKMDFELRSITHPSLYREYATSWEKVSEKLLASSYFGANINSALYLASAAKEIESKYTEPLDKLKAAHEEAKKITWDDYNSLYTSTNTLSFVFKKQKGNSTDINLILFNLLKKLDFDPELIALSTRNNGMFSPYSPSMDKLNYVVIRVKVAEKEYFLDATNKYLPIGFLPTKCWNFNGRTIDKNKSEHVSLIPNFPKMTKVFCMLELTEDQKLIGDMMRSYPGYSGYLFRHGYDDFVDEEEYLQNFEESHDGYYVIENSITGLDDIYKPVSVKSKIEIESKTESIGQQLLVYPILYGALEENPFKDPVRKHIVDFGFPSSFDYTFSLRIPENYTVETLPEKVLMKLPDDAGMLYYNVASTGQQIQIQYKLIMKKQVHTTDEYAALKEFYDLVVQKNTEPIILKSN